MSVCRANWFSLQWILHRDVIEIFKQQKQLCFQQFTRRLGAYGSQSIHGLKDQSCEITPPDTCAELLPGTMGSCFHKVTFRSKNKTCRWNKRCEVLIDWKTEIWNSVQNLPPGEKLFHLKFLGKKPATGENITLNNSTFLSEQPSDKTKLLS